jgi:hypothetical protein
VWDSFLWHWLNACKLSGTLGMSSVIVLHEGEGENVSDAVVVWNTLVVVFSVK